MLQIPNQNESLTPNMWTFYLPLIHMIIDLILPLSAILTFLIQFWNLSQMSFLPLQKKNIFVFFHLLSLIPFWSISFYSTLSMKDMARNVSHSNTLSSLESDSKMEFNQTLICRSFSLKQIGNALYTKNAVILRFQYFFYFWLSQIYNKAFWYSM